MTRPRSELISLADTPYYHCIARCVRRAFLCGDDHYSGRNFDHRKQWLVDRIAMLEAVFAIDIAAYAVMSNHYHLVLHVDSNRAQSWSDDEVIQRWLSLYKGPPLIHRYLKNKTLLAAEMRAVNDITNEWRQRLGSISWFMSKLNEHIAREANKEDNCSGRFWEGRFKSQALLDEAALLSCMTYVDLNPVRAGLTADLDASDFTSIQARTRQIQQKSTTNKPALMPFIETEHQDKQWAMLPFNLKDYIELVDWTGRAIRDDKRGYIPQQTPPILETINLTDEQWLTLTADIQQQSITMLHGLDRLLALERKREPIAA